MHTKKVYSTSIFIRIVVKIVFTVFTFIFRIKKKMPKEVKDLKSPYFVLGNHVGYWDPFITGQFLPHFIHFVASDAVFRKPIIRFLLNGLGTIPKKKNIRDTKVIRDIISVIKQGENVGIFPEAVRNWAGTTQKMDPSIAKLIKKMKVPVVVPILKGMNLFNPRWSSKLRFTKVEVEYKLLFKKEDVLNLTEDEIFNQLNEAMYHDEVEYQKSKMIKVRSKHKAEYINHTLYLCPKCNEIDSFTAAGNEFSCSKCNYDIHINDYSFFERISSGKLYYDNIRDWYKWQEKYLRNYINEQISANFMGLIFEDVNSKVFHSKESKDLAFIGAANVKLYINRIEICFTDKKEVITIDFHKLQTINPQVNERLEIYYNGEAYRIIGGRNGVSALKWEVAANAIWKSMGQNNKLSPYMN